jgi:hypothetical protein
MNTKQVLAAAALTLVGAAASAQTVDTFWQFLPTNQPSTVTREEVRAELVQARQAGAVRGADAIVNVPVQATAQAPAPTREQVRAELAQAVAQADSASNGFGFITPVAASSLSREAVRAEAAAYARARQQGARTSY